MEDHPPVRAPFFIYGRIQFTGVKAYLFLHIYRR